MLQRATTGASGGGAISDVQYFTKILGSSDTTITTTTKKAKGVVFTYLAGGYTRVCRAFDGYDDNYLDINNDTLHYTKVTFTDNAITMGQGLGAQLQISGIVIY